MVVLSVWVDGHGVRLRSCRSLCVDESLPCSGMIDLEQEGFMLMEGLGVGITYLVRAELSHVLW